MTLWERVKRTINLMMILLLRVTELSCSCVCTKIHVWTVRGRRSAAHLSEEGSTVHGSTGNRTFNWDLSFVTCGIRNTVARNDILQFFIRHWRQTLGLKMGRWRQVQLHTRTRLLSNGLCLHYCTTVSDNVTFFSFGVGPPFSSEGRMWDEGTCYQWDRAGVGWMVNDDVDCWMDWVFVLPFFVSYYYSF